MLTYVQTVVKWLDLPVIGHPAGCADRRGLPAGSADCSHGRTEKRDTFYSCLCNPALACDMKASRV
jgi:hypothetical protein